MADQIGCSHRRKLLPQKQPNKKAVILISQSVALSAPSAAPRAKDAVMTKISLAVEILCMGEMPFEMEFSLFRNFSAGRGEVEYPAPNSTSDSGFGI